jgi:hypothetical protein
MFEPEAISHFSYELHLFADYHQLYLEDEDRIEDQPNDWGDQLVVKKIAIAPGIIGIGTARNMTVPVQVDLFDQKPDDDFIDWDYVIEASLEVSSGKIVIAGCSDYLPDATRIPVLPGSYRVRIYYGGMGTISKDGLNGDDRYRVIIWPEEEYRPLEILKELMALEHC